MDAGDRERWWPRSYWQGLFQGRFKHLADTDIDLIQQQVDAEWDLLVRKSK